MFNKSILINSIKSIFDKYLSKQDIVLLAGSFSRNEESFLKKDNFIIPLSDIEFVIFQNSKDFLFKKHHINMYKTLKVIEDKFNIKIDFSIKPKIFLKFVPNTFFWYETLQISKIIYGNKIEFNVNHKNIDSGDVYEVLNHSIISIILKKLYTKDKNIFKYQILKASLDLLIPFLFHYGNLIFTHNKRYEKFQKLSNINIDNDIKKLLEIAYNIKCKKNYVNYKELECLDERFLLDTYLKFSLYLFHLINKEQCKIGDNSLSRLIFKYKIIVKNINYRSILLNSNLLCQVYKLNYIYLSNENSNKIQQFFNIEKISINEIMKINKLVYRYLK